MASKWKKLKGKIDPWQPEPTYQARVDEAKGAYAALSSVELARMFKIQDEHKDEHEARIKLINVEIEALSQMIVSALEGADVQALELESGMRVSIDIKPYVSVLDTPEAHKTYDKWVHSSKIRGLLTLNPKTRDAFIKEDLEAGRPTPVWAKVFLKTRAKLTGKKKENSNGGNDEE